MSVDLFTPNDLGFEIPVDAVNKLRADARKAEDSAKRYAELAAGYNKKLSAIRELAPHLFPAAELISKASVTPEPQQKTVIDAVVDAVDRVGKPMLPKDIRAAIYEQGDGHLITNENYIYTAIKRATDNGRIIRTGDTYTSVHEKGPEE